MDKFNLIGCIVKFCKFLKGTHRNVLVVLFGYSTHRCHSKKSIITISTLPHKDKSTHLYVLIWRLKRHMELIYCKFYISLEGIKRPGFYETHNFKSFRLTCHLFSIQGKIQSGLSKFSYLLKFLLGILTTYWNIFTVFLDKGC